VCCSVLQCVAVCCSVFPCVAVCCSVLQSVPECCSVLQCVAECCSVLQCVALCCSVLKFVVTCCRVLRCVAVCCGVLQCSVMCCSVLQCVAVYLACVGAMSAVDKYVYIYNTHTDICICLYTRTYMHQYCIHIYIHTWHAQRQTYTYSYVYIYTYTYRSFDLSITLLRVYFCIYFELMYIKKKTCIRISIHFFFPHIHTHRDLSICLSLCLHHLSTPVSAYIFVSMYVYNSNCIHFPRFFLCLCLYTCLRLFPVCFSSTSVCISYISRVCIYLCTRLENKNKKKKIYYILPTHIQKKKNVYAPMHKCIWQDYLYVYTHKIVSVCAHFELNHLVHCCDVTHICRHMYTCVYI